MPLLDRREVLASTDLTDLATDVCGPPRGRGRSARWHCPSPEHPDRTPSMGIYTTPSSEQRWKCHACGEGGSAVDLVMISTGMGAGDALRELARRAGIDDGVTHAPTTGRITGHRTAAPRATYLRPAPVVATRADPSVEALVAAAADLLWQPVGRLARRTLAKRGFPDDFLRANRVGFDPGPALLPRPKGLPRLGPGIVFPALDPNGGDAVYYQVRALSPAVAAERKYDQPTAELAPNPRLVAVRGTHPSTSSTVAICEGFPDAYTAQLAGLVGVAMLGISHAGRDGVRDLAQRILTEYPALAYAICFDNEPKATQLAYRLAGHLAHHGPTATRLQPPAGLKDLNIWWQAHPASLTEELTAVPIISRSDARLTVPSAMLQV